MTLASPTMDAAALKVEAARAALAHVGSGMRLGIGSGSTAEAFVRLLAERVEGGLKVIGVPTSERTAALCSKLGVPLSSLEETPELDLTIDGADEVDGDLALIKGGGGALLREKIVESAAKRFIVVADSSKLVPTLGHFPLPVEVIQMALPIVAPKLEALGLNPKLRHHPDGSLYVTDEGNVILDCAAGSIPDPAKTAAEIRAIVGVVEHGLFLNMASLALIAGEDGVREVLP